MKRALPALCGALLLAGACRDPDVVAQVGSTKIRRADLDEYASRLPSSEREKPQALEALVERALLAEAARKRGLQDQSQVRARIAAGEREALAEAVTSAELSAASDDAALRKRYDTEKAALSRRRVHVAHIFVQLPRGADAAGRDAARARAQRIYGRALAGESFEALARTESDDKVSGARGGDLGPLDEGSVARPFFDAAATLKKGEIGKPVETDFGVHVLRAVEDVTLVTPTFEEARSKLAAEARRQRENELLEQLRREIPVKLRMTEITPAVNR